MLINLRNALMGGKRLPYDAEVEFLQSTGTQWIDTGLLGRDGYDFEYSFSPLPPLLCGIGGEYEDNRNCYIGLVRNNGNLAYNYYTPNIIVEVQSLTLGTDYNVKAHLYSGEQYFEVNGVRGGIGSKAGSFVSSFSLYVFAINSNNQPILNANMRLYSLKIYLNGTLVRDYIPVRVGTVGYLYDRVSGALFGNAGTGDFVLGPDVVPVEYLRHTGTQWIDTGYAMADSRKINIRVNWSAHSTTSREMMGGGASGSYFVEVNANGYYAVGATASTISSIKAEGTDNLTWVYNVGEKPTLSVNGALAATDSNIRVPSGTFKTAISASFAPHCDLYALGIYTDNDEQTRMMLPVRVGTEGAMMDTLTRRIYRNAGTGAFTYGNDLKYPIPAE